ncbi:hypothetical protein F2P79_014898 [Pimephales promelas]|nr:hypothetical protein F2P79_014898 [Pimephales promelas]
MLTGHQSGHSKQEVEAKQDPIGCVVSATVWTEQGVKVFVVGTGFRSGKDRRFLDDCCLRKGFVFVCCGSDRNAQQPEIQQHIGDISLYLTLPLL